MKMATHIQVLLFIIYQMTCASSLMIEGISLMGEKDYLRLQTDKSAVLQCHYKLTEGLTAKTVTWYHDDDLALTWEPPEPAKIGKGLKEGEAVLSRQDGHLEFAQINLDLAGIYRCEVMTSDGVTSKSPTYQLLIIDMPEIPDDAKYKVEDCKIVFSWSAPAVRPKPDIKCGIWSLKHEYVLTATKWTAVPYYNGSIAYSLEDEIFDISQMPLDAVVRCELKMTKIDDSEITLRENNYNITEVWERGCHPLDVGEGIFLQYDNERLTCHAELKPKDPPSPVIAHVKCAEGHEPKYSDYVTAVDLVCKDNRWDIAGNLTWNHFDNLLCVEKSEVSTPPPSPKREKVDEKMQEETTSSVKRPITPWLLILILGLILLSGVIWGFKTQTREKRHMA